MSIEIIHEQGRSRPAFRCDRCNAIIADPDQGIFVWNYDPANQRPLPSELLCEGCDDQNDCKQPASEELPTALIYLLVHAGWLDRKLRPTAKMRQAAECAGVLAMF